MGNYLKLSDETRRIEQKVQRLHNKRLCLVIGEYKKNNSNLCIVVKKKEDTIESLNCRISELENEIKDCKLRIEEKSFKIEELEKMIEEKDKIIFDQSKTIEQQLQTIDGHLSKQNTYSNLEAGKKNLEQELKNVKKELKKQHACEIKELKEKHADELEKVNLQYKDLLNENIKLKGDINNLNITKVEKKTDKFFEYKKILDKLDEYKNIFVHRNKENLDKKAYENTNVLIHDLGEVFKEINKISNIIDDVKNYNKDILDRVRFEDRKISESTKNDDQLKYNNALLENTISTLKETIKIKDDIIKNQNKLMSNKKGSRINVAEDSSSDILIKPEDVNKIVFDSEEIQEKKKVKNVRPYRKRKKEENPQKNKTIENTKNKELEAKKDFKEKDKNFLPKDLPKSNASFFANLTFTDSSPFTKKK